MIGKGVQAVIVGETNILYYVFFRPTTSTEVSILPIKTSRFASGMSEGLGETDFVFENYEVIFLALE